MKKETEEISRQLLEMLNFEAPARRSFRCPGHSVRGAALHLLNIFPAYVGGAILNAPNVGWRFRFTLAGCNLVGI